MDLPDLILLAAVAGIAVAVASGVVIDLLLCGCLLADTSDEE